MKPMSTMVVAAAVGSSATATAVVAAVTGTVQACPPNRSALSKSSITMGCASVELLDGVVVTKCHAAAKPVTPPPTIATRRQSLLILSYRCSTVAGLNAYALCCFSSLPIATVCSWWLVAGFDVVLVMLTMQKMYLYVPNGSCRRTARRYTVRYFLDSIHVVGMRCCRNSLIVAVLASQGRDDIEYRYDSRSVHTDGLKIGKVDQTRVFLNSTSLVVVH